MNERPKSRKIAETVAVDNIRVNPITPQESPTFDNRVSAETRRKSVNLRETLKLGYSPFVMKCLQQDTNIS
jgi:hypothetical protein